MANFSIALQTTGGHEGGYTVDNGGETYKGISRKAWRQWEGWAFIDAYKKKYGTPAKESFIKSAALDNAVMLFYKKNYWDKTYGDYISNQTLANFIYDFYVNSNSALAIINRALGTAATSTLNAASLKIINEQPALAYQAIYNARSAHYTKLSLKPKLKKYKAGWFSRLAAFPKTLAA